MTHPLVAAYTGYVSPLQKAPKNNASLPLLLATGLIGALLTTACGTTQSKAHQRAVTAEKAQQRTEENLIRAPLDPVHLSRDYVHPPFTIRQAFLWGPYENEWRWSVVDPAAEYVGFLVKNPFPLPARIDGMVLYFELSPPRAASGLAIGLIDDRRRNVTTTPVLPIAPYRIHTRFPSRNARFAIPLREFEEPAGRRLHWGNIVGVHAVRLEPHTASPQQIIIHQLKFAPALWVEELQKGVTRP